MRGEQSVDAALLTVVLALFTASAFGLTELPGGFTSWEPKEWKGVHDAAKALILPLLALRLGLALSGRENADLILRNRVWVAMALCWVGDIALTFSGDTAFLIGLVSFLLGHIVFIMAYRHMFVSGWGRSRGLFHGVAGGVLFVVAATVARTLWEPAGDLGPAVAVYAFVIYAMAYCSWMLDNGPGVWVLRLGTTAFMASDIILAFGRFGEAPIAHGHFWVIGTYIIAQWALSIGFSRVASRRGATHP